jgi:phenylalanyl-tRNA synthetase beta chain
MTVISDNVGVESLAGIMGGSGSGCSDNTENVFIEAAYFNPITTAYTGRELKINSDARYRFERGIDPEWTAFGIEAATKMIIELCGGEPSEVIQAGEIPNHSRAYKVDTARIESLVGMSIPADDQLKILENLGFVINDDNARVPSWRPDVQGEADLVEEVARVVSLTKLQGIPLPRVSESVPKSVLSATQIREQTSRRAAAGM